MREQGDLNCELGKLLHDILEQTRLCRCNPREIYEACCSPTISVATGLLVTPNASYRRTSAAAKIPHSIKPRRHRSHKGSTTPFADLGPEGLEGTVYAGDPLTLGVTITTTLGSVQLTKKGMIE